MFKDRLYQEFGLQIKKNPTERKFEIVFNETGYL